MADKPKRSAEGWANEPSDAEVVKIDGSLDDEENVDWLNEKKKPNEPKGNS